jgi:hypothetical protein
VSVLDALAVLAAGFAAGTVNTIVGSGTLITFPVLLAVGYSPVVANVSNTIGLVPGSISGAYGYRRELSGQRRRVLVLGIASVTGGIVGALLLLSLPAAAFAAIVPIFIGIAVLLVLLQPRLTVLLAARRRRPRGRRPSLVPPALFGIGIYGGYFGAAQGIMLLAVLGLALPEGLQRVNALKNVLAGATNLVAGVVFVAVADVAWGAALLLAAGSVVGGQVGAHIGRRLPAGAIRVLVAVIGLVAIVQLALR